MIILQQSLPFSTFIQNTEYLYGRIVFDSRVKNDVIADKQSPYTESRVRFFLERTLPKWKCM